MCVFLHLVRRLQLLHQQHYWGTAVAPTRQGTYMYEFMHNVYITVYMYHYNYTDAAAYVFQLLTN